MMNYLDQPAVQYTNETEFMQNQLAALTPAHIMRYLNFRVFGVPNPPADHDLNPQVRGNSVSYWKKAISYFMPNKMMQWNQVSGMGNPTKSVEVNQLVRFIWRKEVRGQGAAKQARRAATHDEFVQMHDIFKAEGNGNIEKYGIPAMMNYQYHLIGRIDDVSQA
ncbi:hypothetical protein, partial [Flagellimonas marinaquae]